MKAKLLKENRNGKNWGNEKEMTGTWNAIVSTRDGLHCPVTVRTYTGRSKSASVVHATVWVSSDKFYSSGSANAGGYGYHKDSEAVARAIESAGIELEKDIGGTGDNNIIVAIGAIVRALGYRGRLTVIRN